MRASLILLVLIPVALASFWAGWKVGAGHPAENRVAGRVSVVVLNALENRIILSENVNIWTGQTVFEVTSRVAAVEYKSYPMVGKYITSIQGLAQTENAWWLYYVNGQLAGIACDRYGLMDGDNVLWKYTNEMPF